MAELYAFSNITHGKGKDRTIFKPGEKIKGFDRETLKELVAAGAVVTYDVTAASKPIDLDESSDGEGSDEGTGTAAGTGSDSGKSEEGK